MHAPVIVIGPDIRVAGLPAGFPVKPAIAERIRRTSGPIAVGPQDDLPGLFDVF
jgi:hypothetical protein